MAHSGPMFSGMQMAVASPATATGGGSSTSSSSGLGTMSYPKHHPTHSHQSLPRRGGQLLYGHPTPHTAAAQSEVPLATLLPPDHPPIPHHGHVPNSR